MEFDVIFKGEVAKGFKIADVKNSLSIAFKLPEDKVERLFTGKPVPLKKSISSEKADALKQSLLRMGAVAYVAPVVVDQQKNNAIAKGNLALSLVPIGVAQDSKFAASDHVAPENDDDQKGERKSFEIPHINFMGIFLFLIGLALLIVFSPYPDLIVRKGFVLGAVCLLLGIRKLRSKG